MRNTSDLPFSPAAQRNQGPILDALRTLLPSGARVLEIGSGTGQHAVAFAAALPGIDWQPSEQAAAITSLAERIERERAQLPPPLTLDVCANWPRKRYDVVFTANTTHIMSWAGVCAMIKGASGVLEPRGKLLIYGPFTQNGQHNAYSNELFDRQLRAADPTQGIRDLNAIGIEAQAHRLRLVDLVDMPANNRIAVFVKDDVPHD